MTTRSNTIKPLFIFVLGFSLVLFNTQLVKAEDENRAQDFCNKVATYQKQFDQKIESSTRSFSQTLTQQQQALEQSIEKRNTLIKRNRDTWDATRQKHYTKMLEQAKSDNQKDAIRIYRDKVEAAVANERNTIDTVHKNYQESIILFVSARDGKAQSIAQDYSKAVKTAFETANSTCRSGADSLSTRNQLKSSMQRASQNLLISQAGAGSNGQSLTTMAIAQQQRLADSRRQFQAVLQAASQELQAQSQ